jgi:hypothetical protein
MTVRVRRSLRAGVARLTSTMAATRSVTAMAAVAVVCVGGFALAWPAAAASAAADASRTASLSGTVAVAQLPAARLGPRPGQADGSPTTAAQRARQDFATAASLDQAIWAQTGEPDRLIIIRATSVDVIQDDTLLIHLPRAMGIVTFPWLALKIGSPWISMPNSSTAVLSAALLLSPGTRMLVGPDVRRLFLTGGTARASASWIRCEQASLTISGVALSSLRAGNQAGGQPVPAPWGGRPYVYAAAGARLDVTGSTVSDLGEPSQQAGAPASATRSGAPPASARAITAGVSWAKGSTGSAVNVRFERNQVGLALVRSVGVRLRDVTVENSVLDGLLLRGDRGTNLTEVTSRSNGGSGIVISGGGSRHLSGLIAAANGAAGVSAVTQAGLVLTGVRTAADTGGGVRLVGCVRCTVSDLVAVGDHQTALAISGASHDVSVTGANLTGGQIGIAIAAGTRTVTLRRAVVTGFRQLGVGIAGTGVSVLGSQISGSPVAVRVYGSAAGIQLSRVTVRGGVDGVTVTHTVASVSLSDVTVTGVAHNGVISASAALRMSGGHIYGGQVGISLLAPADITGVDIGRVVTGIHDRAPGTVDASQIHVVAERYGIKAGAGARVDLSDSVIRAPVTLTGAGYISRDSLTVLSLPPIPWLGFTAITAVLLAITLQTIHLLRGRSPRAPRLPRHARRQYAEDFGPGKDLVAR